MTGTTRVGGLVGTYNYVSTFTPNNANVTNYLGTQLSASGAVTASSSYAGGLIGAYNFNYGSNFNTEVMNLSYASATGTVTGASSYVGGLIGSTTITDSHREAETAKAHRG